MTELNLEFSNQFDVLYNNIMSNQAPGLDEYEKSVIFTDAQKQLILSYYNGNNTNDFSFEKTEEVRRYLERLIKTAVLEEDQSYDSTLLIGGSSSKVFTLPDNLWFITYEAVRVQDTGECKNGRELLVVPTTQDEYYRTQDNPFKKANIRRALRLDIGMTENQETTEEEDKIKDKVEIVSDYDNIKYLIRYMEKPSPIILTDLTGEGLTIDGVSEETECKLHPALHKTIIDLAVALAAKNYKG